MQNQEITREPVHVIYRLHGSIAAAKGVAMQREYEEAKMAVRLAFEPEEDLDPHGIVAYQEAMAEVHRKFELKFDEYLDRRVVGPMYLADASAKQIVIDSWLKLEEITPVEIDVISVMSNHVHIILSHQEEEGVMWLDPILTRHKRYTSRAIKKMFDIKENRVWANGYFDRLVRRKSYGTVLHYVLNNPVKAGLTDDGLNWIGNYFARKV